MLLQNVFLNNPTKGSTNPLDILFDASISAPTFSSNDANNRQRPPSDLSLGCFQQCLKKLSEVFLQAHADLSLHTSLNLSLLQGLHVQELQMLQV